MRKSLQYISMMVKGQAYSVKHALEEYSENDRRGARAYHIDNADGKKISLLVLNDKYPGEYMAITGGQGSISIGSRLDISFGKIHDTDMWTRFGDKCSKVYSSDSGDRRMDVTKANAAKIDKFIGLTA